MGAAINAGGRADILSANLFIGTVSLLVEIPNALRAQSRIPVQPPVGRNSLAE
jgi:hypothetical protein